MVEPIKREGLLKQKLKKLSKPFEEEMETAFETIRPDLPPFHLKCSQTMSLND